MQPRATAPHLLIDDDIHNVRTALAWAKEHDVQAALSLTAPLLHWIGQRGPYTEGQRLIEKIFALPDASAPHDSPCEGSV